MDISEQISRMAEEYDSDLSGEVAQVRAFTQGLLVGGVMRQKLLKVAHVETPKDSEGNYLHHFIIVTESGIRLKVSVEGA